MDDASDVIVSQVKDNRHFHIAPGQNTFISVKVELNKEDKTEENIKEGNISECKDIR